MKIIDLFSGVGGFSLGFQMAGFSPVAACEIVSIHAQTYQENFAAAQMFNGDIASLPLDSLSNLDIAIAIGGSPCQGFSEQGKRDEGDSRNQLIFEYARVVRELDVDYFVFENVERIQKTEVFTEFLNLLRSFGYRVEIWEMVASDYGIPQKRCRIFVVGAKVGKPFPAPPLPFCAPVCVADALEDLSNPEIMGEYFYESHAGELELKSPKTSYAQWMRGELVPQSVKMDWKKVASNRVTHSQLTRHCPEVLERFEKLDYGKRDRSSRQTKIDPAGFAPTIRAGTGGDRGRFTALRHIHPFDNRVLTVRESARLQSFPDWFTFSGTKNRALQQVGNAVPPLLAFQVAQSVAQVI